MEIRHAVRCSENEGIAAHLLQKQRDLADRNALPENIQLTLANAYRSIAGCKTPIVTLKDLSKIKGVGKWILRLMKGFFPDEVDGAPSCNEKQKGRKPKEPKRYVPRKNSVAYALLITLYRATKDGSGFMRKQELIDAAEASGLSGTSIVREKGVGKPGQFGSSPRDWYTGWSCMKTLISKGLVVKSNCPAKYMLTDEGQESARECLLRSGTSDPMELISKTNGLVTSSMSHDLEGDVAPSTSKNNTRPSTASSQPIHSVDIAIASFTGNSDMLQLDISDSESEDHIGKDTFTATACTSSVSGLTFNGGCNATADQRSFIIQPCTSLDHPMNLPPCNTSSDIKVAELAMPPYGAGERFEDIYEITLVLDDRENFGSRSRKIFDILSSQFKVSVESRRLPVGDGIWVARHRELNMEYVLDFIVERKRVDDLRHSIRDNRYRDQKLRLLRCGLKKLIYLVEGDPNGCEAAESIKTACFTTEILEGFDVQRTTGFNETVKKYGFLTKAISEAYREQFLNANSTHGRVCPSFNEFVKKCQDLEKLTISDVFSLQLMQVPQVTEEIALAVVDLYPTLISLARAYSLLEGDVSTQEEMLKRKSNLISGSASRNIFKLVWGS